tara:strand:+ start:914 stop:1210 length:297 start_codon:yes stop_codon:yes gene_type:complete
MNGVKMTLTKEGTVYFAKRCTVTKEDYSVEITIPKYVMWREKKYLIQNIFPDLTADDREFLVSGCTPAEWDTMMGEPDDFCANCGKERGGCPCENTLR